MIEIALIGKKIGMTREFYKSGQLVPVTVIKMEKARVIEVINEEKRGYKAIQLGYGKIKNSKLTKSMKGFFAKKGKLIAVIKINKTCKKEEISILLFNLITFVCMVLKLMLL